MKLTKILSISLASMLFLTTCTLDEEVYTFVAGDDVAEAKSYDQLVSGAYLTLLFPFEWGNFHNAVNFDSDYQTGPNWAFGKVGAGNFNEPDGPTDLVFTYYSQSVHRANYHYYLVDKIAGISDKLKNNAKGELRFLKAWAQFQMVQYYGPIPLYKYSISEGNSTALPRSSVKDVYAHIIETLKEAETILVPRTDAEYVKGHVCRGTAKALLAKVYATIGSASMQSGQITVKGGPGTRTNPDGTVSRLMPVPITHTKNVVAGYEDFDSQEYYRLAKEKALEVITDGEFSLAKDQKELWSAAYKNGPEFEFCLQTKNGETSLYNNYVATDYYGWANPVYHGEWSEGYYTQRDHWLQLFDDWNDDRITWGVLHRFPTTYTEATGSMQYSFYPERDSVYVKAGTNGYSTTDVIATGATYGARLSKFLCVSVTPLDGNRNDYNWPYMRYAETLLIYAEADNEVNNGPSEKALDVVTLLNNRNNSTTAIARNTARPYTKETFRSYILEERAKEFPAEGIRRLDLIRWGIYLQVMNAIGTNDENGNVKRREAKHLLFPLPAAEVAANPNIEVNNPGW